LTKRRTSPDHHADETAASKINTRRDIPTVTAHFGIMRSRPRRGDPARSARHLGAVFAADDKCAATALTQDPLQCGRCGRLCLGLLRGGSTELQRSSAAAPSARFRSGEQPSSCGPVLVATQAALRRPATPSSTSREGTLEVSFRRSVAARLPFGSAPIARPLPGAPIRRARPPPRAPVPTRPAATMQPPRVRRRRGPRRSAPSRRRAGTSESRPRPQPRARPRRRLHARACRRALQLAGAYSSRMRTQAMV